MKRILFAVLMASGMMAQAQAEVILPDSEVSKTQYFGEFASVYLNNGCVLVGKSLSGSATDRRFKNHGYLCEGHQSVSLASDVFLIPEGHTRAANVERAVQ